MDDLLIYTGIQEGAWRVCESAQLYRLNECAKGFTIAALSWWGCLFRASSNRLGGAMSHVIYMCRRRRWWWRYSYMKAASCGPRNQCASMFACGQMIAGLGIIDAAICIIKSAIGGSAAARRCPACASIVRNFRLWDYIGKYARGHMWFIEEKMFKYLNSK